MKHWVYKKPIAFELKKIDDFLHEIVTIFKKYGYSIYQKEGDLIIGKYCDNDVIALNLAFFDESIEDERNREKNT